MRYDVNRQRMIDDLMCKPGYTWNETLKRCLRYGPSKSSSDSSTEIAKEGQIPAENSPKKTKSATPEQNIVKEVAKRVMKAGKKVINN